MEGYIDNIVIDQTALYDIINVSRSLKKMSLYQLNWLKDRGAFTFPENITSDTFSRYLFCKKGEFDSKIRSQIRGTMEDIYFNIVGSEKGSNLTKFRQNIAKAITQRLTKDLTKTYKIIEQSRKNLRVKIEKIEGHNAICYCYIFEEKVYLTVNVNDLIEVDLSEQVFNFAENYIRYNYLQENKQLIIDGDFLLMNSLISYPTLYSTESNLYVGAFYGAYFTLLKLKQQFIDYNFKIAFGSNNSGIYKVSNCYKYVKLDDNKLAEIDKHIKPIKKDIIEFCLSVGISVHINEEHSIENVIYGLIKKGQETIIYSRNLAMGFLIGKEVSLYFNKIEPQDFERHYYNKETFIKEQLKDYKGKIQNYTDWKFTESCMLQTHNKKYFHILFRIKKNFKDIKDSIKYLRNYREFIATYKPQNLEKAKSKTIQGKKNYKKYKQLLEKHSFHREASVASNVYAILTSYF